MPHPDSLFAPPAEPWTPVSPRYVQVKVISALLWWGVLTAGAAALMLLFFGRWQAMLAAGIGIVLTGWAIWRAVVVARSWGYAIRQSDLYITHGRLFRSLIVVPYGRMQAVSVNAGPIQRAFGLATVQLITASVDSNATIPGLTATVAAQLRDQLTELGEEQATGL